MRFAPLALLLLWLLPAPAGAADDDWLYSDEWRFRASPYIWALGITGDATVRNVHANIDASFSDIWRNLDMALMGRFAAEKEDWAFGVEPLYAWLSTDAHVGPLEADVDATMTLLGFGALRTLYRGPLAEGSDRRLKVEAGAGGIYVRLKTDIDLPGALPDPDFKESWVDPTVNARFTLELNEDWLCRGAGSVGGFGIGEASDLVLGGELLFGRRLNDRTSLWLGYRALSFDREQGSGPSKTKFDVTLHGPIAAVSVSF